MTKTTNATQAADEHELEKLADALEADTELYGATLDGLQARMDANAAKLEGSDIDTRMHAADEDAAQMGVDVLAKDVADSEELDTDMVAVDAEEDKQLEDDELPVEETAATLTPDDTGLPEQ